MSLLPRLSLNLALPRCPHCSIAGPHLWRKESFTTEDHENNNRRYWAVYICSSCGGVVTAWSDYSDGAVKEHFPEPSFVKDDIPERPREYLQQAIESLHAPAGAVMLAASAVDSMLKLKNYSKGSLNSRINDAAKDHLITKEMATWAHEVRLDANDQRHADEEADLPTTEDASRVISFAIALAEFLFVLPNRVQRGIKESSANS